MIDGVDDMSGSRIYKIIDVETPNVTVSGVDAGEMLVLKTTQFKFTPRVGHRIQIMYDDDGSIVMIEPTDSSDWSDVVSRVVHKDSGIDKRAVLDAILSFTKCHPIVSVVIGTFVIAVIAAPFDGAFDDSDTPGSSRTERVSSKESSSVSASSKKESQGSFAKAWSSASAVASSKKAAEPSVDTTAKDVATADGIIYNPSYLGFEKDASNVYDYVNDGNYTGPYITFSYTIKNMTGNVYELGGGSSDVDAVYAPDGSKCDLMLATGSTTSVASGHMTNDSVAIMPKGDGQYKVVLRPLLVVDDQSGKSITIAFTVKNVDNVSRE